MHALYYLHTQNSAKIEYRTLNASNIDTATVFVLKPYSYLGSECIQTALNRYTDRQINTNEV